MKRKMKTFYQWLRTHKEEDSPLGDLAIDAKDDGHFPRGMVKDREIIRRYLEAKNACNGALEAFEDAWEGYEIYCEDFSFLSLGEDDSLCTASKKLLDGMDKNQLQKAYEYLRDQKQLGELLREKGA